MKKSFFGFILLTLSFLAFSHYAKAQGLMVLDEQHKTSFILQYDNNQEDSVLINSIVSDIAKGIQKNKNLVRFELNYHWHIKLFKLSSGEYKLQLHLDSLEMDGDNLYKAFSVLEIIKPYNIFAEIVLNDLNSTQSQHFRQQLNGSLAEVGFTYLFQDSSRQAFWKLSKFEINKAYSPIQKNEFQEFIVQTNSYFEAYKKLIQIENQLKTFNLNNTTMIPLYNVDLRDMEKDILELTPDKKVNLLSLSSVDPENYLTKYDSLSKRIIQLRISFNSMISSMDMEYLTKGKSMEAEGNKSEALRYYKKSIAVNPNYCPAYLTLSQFYLKSDSFELSCNTLNFLLDSLKPDFETKNNALNFADILLERICIKGEDLNQKELYLDAIDIFSSGIRFCNNTKGFKCSDRMNKGMKQAKYGLYNSYLVIANKAFEKKKYDMVQEYLKYAVDYQKLNHDEINGVPEVDKIYKQLANLSMLKAQKLIEKKEFAEALIELDLTEKTTQNLHQKDENLEQEILEMRKLAHQGIFDEMLAQSKNRRNSQDQETAELKLKKANEYKQNNSGFISESAKADSAQIRLKRSMYRHHIESGISFLESGNNSLALEAFKNAKDIESQISVIKDLNLNTLMGKAAKPQLMEKISDGKLKAWASRFEEATQIYRAVQIEIENYQLQNDPEITSLMNDLLAKIQNNLCSLVSFDFRSAMQKGFLNADLKDYLNASFQWQKAIDYARLNPSCSIDTTLASNLLNKYSEEIYIQFCNQKCYTFLSSNDLDSFIFYYHKSFSTYTSQIEKFRFIGVPNLVEICKTHSENELLLISSIEYLINNQRIDESFKVTLMLSKPALHHIANRNLLMQHAKILATTDAGNKNVGKMSLYNSRFKGTKIPMFYKINYLKNLF